MRGSHSPGIWVVAGADHDCSISSDGVLGDDSDHDIEEGCRQYSKIILAKCWLC